MKIIKSFGLVVSMVLMSLSCFAGTRFYCPEPSSLHAEGTKESYKYIGTNESGIVFESTEGITGDIKTAPILTGFRGAGWQEWNEKSHDCTCLYKNALGYGVDVDAHFHGSFKPVGNAWLWFLEDEESQAVCSSSNRHDCALEFNP